MNRPSLIVVFYAVLAAIVLVPLAFGLLHALLGGTPRKRYAGRLAVRPPYYVSCSCCGETLTPLTTHTDGQSLRYLLACNCGNEEWHDGERVLRRRPDDSFARMA